ncbi:MAG: hypothetical protein RR404_04395 [Bacilli bacterium]
MKQYIKNKKQTRFDILKNYLSGSNNNLKFKNRYKIKQAINNINDELEEAQKEFSKLFDSNEYQK